MAVCRLTATRSSAAHCLAPDIQEVSVQFRPSRAKVSGGTAGTILYAYDEAGHLLGEYGAAGTLIQETVWLGDTPVATLRPSGSAGSGYYIQSDQLNTPRQVPRPSDNSPMWTWNSDPFGTDAANANPAGAGAFA